MNIRKIRIGMRTIKTAIGSIVAMLIAKQIGLMFWPAAGIITILTIQNTKKKSYVIAWQRIISLLLGTLISFAAFKTMGFTPLSFGLFLLIFIPTCVYFNVIDGIVPSAVLVTNILITKNIGLENYLTINAINIIGVIIAILLNIYMPSLESELKKDKHIIEAKMKNILYRIAHGLIENVKYIDDEKLMPSLRNSIEHMCGVAIRNHENQNTKESKKYNSYVEMRTVQYWIIENIRKQTNLIDNNTKEIKELAELIIKIGDVFGENIENINLIKETKEVLEIYRKKNLPATRAEFESRAIILKILYDIGEILEVKETFIKEENGKNI